MQREHVAIAVLLVVLLVGVLLSVVGQTRDDAVAAPDGDGRVPGRHLRLDELSGSCLDAGPPPLITGSCVLTVTSTAVPVRDLPLVTRWLPRELRRLDLTQPGGGPCAAVVELRSGAVEIDADLDPGDDASLPLDAGGGTVAVLLPLGCVLVVGEG